MPGNPQAVCITYVPNVGLRWDLCVFVGPLHQVQLSPFIFMSGMSSKLCLFPSNLCELGASASSTHKNPVSNVEAVTILLQNFTHEDKGLQDRAPSPVLSQ